MLEARLASVTLKVMTKQRLAEIIEACKEGEDVKVDGLEGSIRVREADVERLMLIGTDYENNRVIRIEIIDNQVMACIIEYE